MRGSPSNRPEMMLGVRPLAGNEVALDVTLGAETTRIGYRFDRGPVVASTDAALVAALPAAMRAGTDVVVTGSVSPRLLAAVPRIAEVIEGWRTGSRRVRVLAEPRPAPAAERAEGTACFFSGGVDSFYSVLRHLDAITHLVYVHGFESAEPRDVDGRVSLLLRQATADLGRQLVEVRTDLRAFTDRYEPWDRTCVAGLASVALMLAPRFGRVIVPSSYSEGRLIPEMPHPILDPLWSTEQVSFVHDGRETTRLRKLTMVAANEVALRSLHVCFRDVTEGVNCGRCEKCLRTMVGLRILGALDRCATLPALDLERLSRFLIPLPEVMVFWRELLDAAEDAATDRPLVAALRRPAALAIRRLRRSTHARAGAPIGGRR